MKTHSATKIVTTMSIMSLIGLGCSGTPQKVSEEHGRRSYTEESEGAAINNRVALEARAHEFVEVEFEPQSAVLTSSAQTSLDRLVSDAKNMGKIEEALVMSWADEEYPSKAKRELSKAQRDLAEKRNEAIKKYLTLNQKIDVDVYNMAKQPNAFSKWFNTTDNKLKKSFVAAGLPTTENELKYPSKASHAVILIKVE